MIKRTWETSAKIVELLAIGGGGLSAIIIIGMSIIITYEVVMRYVFNAPTNWVTEYSGYAVVAASFFGAAYCFQKGKHIIVDVFTTRFSKKTSVCLEFVTLLWSAGFLGILSHSAINMIILSYRIREMSPSILQVPLWIPGLAVAIGAILLTLQVIVLAVNKGIEMTHIKKGEEAKRSFVSSIDKPGLVIAITLVLLIFSTVVFYQDGPLRIIGLLGLMLTILASGTPIFLSLSMVGAAGLFITHGSSLTAVAQLAAIAYGTLQSFTLGAIPLFIFFGAIFAATGLTESLFTAINAWLSNFRGNLVLATIASCAVFAAISGSSAATAATIGMIAVPAMIAMGYDKSLTTGATAAAGTLGSLIPPSLGFIVYGSITQTSVGKLFIAGIIPGLMLTSMMMLYAFLVCRKDPRYKPSIGVTWKMRFSLLKKTIWVILVPIIILGGIYSGICTPTESAGIAVIYAIVLGFVFRRFTFKNVSKILIDGTNFTCALMMIIAGAMIFGTVVATLHIPQEVTQIVINSPLPPWGVLVMINIFLFILGMFLEAVSIAMITLPIIFPVIMTLGYDPIWFGAMFIMNMEVCVISPPIGLNLFVLQGVSGEKIETIVKGVLPFIGIIILGMLIVALFPQLATWLPSTMMGH